MNVIKCTCNGVIVSGKLNKKFKKIYHNMTHNITNEVLFMTGKPFKTVHFLGKDEHKLFPLRSLIFADNNYQMTHI